MADTLITLHDDKGEYLCSACTTANTEGRTLEEIKNYLKGPYSRWLYDRAGASGLDVRQFKQKVRRADSFTLKAVE